MSWLSLLAGIVKLFGSFVDWFRSEQLRKAGEDKARKEQLERTNDETLAAAKDRAAVSGLSDADLDRELQQWSRPPRAD